MKKRRNKKDIGFWKECKCKTEDFETQEKYKNDCLIGPQEKYRNRMREIDSKDFYQEVGPLAKFPPKSICNKLFHRNFIGIGKVQSFESNGYIGKFPIRFQSYEIPS